MGCEKRVMSGPVIKFSNKESTIKSTVKVCPGNCRLPSDVSNFCPHCGRKIELSVIEKKCKLYDNRKELYEIFERFNTYDNLNMLSEDYPLVFHDYQFSSIYDDPCFFEPNTNSLDQFVNKYNDLINYLTENNYVFEVKNINTLYWY